MSWRVFNAEFKAKTSLHIGYHKVGLLQRTRYYVPGKLLWAGLTAKVTPILKNKPTGSDYKDIGDFLQENMIFSYYFLKCEGNEFKPKFIEGIGLTYGIKSTQEFEKSFITSIPSTAIDSETMSAEDETLHEIEVISSHNKESNQPVSIFGHIFVKEGVDGNLSLDVEDNEIKFNGTSINDILKDGIFVGGERRYGLGYIQLEDNVKDVDNSKFTVKNDKVCTELKQGETIEAHLGTNDSVSLKGEIEAVSGRNWGKKGAGRSLSESFLAWIPGSIVEEKMLVEVGKFGIWEKN